MASATTSSENVERRCENADCLVGELVSRIPKRKTPQFIVNPTIIEKPLLVNNFNSVFQVDGVSAKFSDIQSNSNAVTNTIYRIIPNTHAHIVNYVVVDDDGEAMRKINASDPTTISKLLKSQVASAQKMLHKLMTEQGTMVNVSYNNKSGSVAVIKSGAAGTTTSTTLPTAALPINPATATTPDKNILLGLPMTTTITTTAAPAPAVATTTTTSIGIAKLPLKQTTATITPLKTGAVTTLPISISPTAATLSKTYRLNPQIKITKKILPKPPTVIGTGSAKAILPTPTNNNNNSSNNNSTPLIKTVPLSQLQKPSVLQNRPFTTTITASRSPMTTTLKTTATGGISSSVILPPPSFSSSSSTISATSPIEYPPEAKAITTADPTEEPISIEVMKKELDDLRRTVAILAARQPITTTPTTAITETAPVTATAAAVPTIIKKPESVIAIATTAQPRAKRARLEK